MEFNNNEALLLIDAMIKTARREIRDNGFFFLLWGWTIFLAALAHYLLEIYPTPLPSPLVWPVFTLVAGIWSIIASRKKSREQKVQTYVEDFLRGLWMAFGIGLTLALFITISLAPLLIFPVCLIIYGIGCFTSGKVLRFRPLLWGAGICWLLAVISAFMDDYNLQILTFAAGVFFSYILPGHLLKRDFDKHT